MRGRRRRRCHWAPADARSRSRRPRREAPPSRRDRGTWPRARRGWPAAPGTGSTPRRPRRTRPCCRPASLAWAGARGSRWRAAPAHRSPCRQARYLGAFRRLAPGRPACASGSSVLRADEFVQPGDRLPLGHRDRRRLREPPGDPEAVERLPAQPVYVGRHVDEQIPRVLVAAIAALNRAPDPVDKPAAVRVKEATSEIPGVSANDLLLPLLELDLALVLPPGPMLRKQTRPVL